MYKGIDVSDNQSVIDWGKVKQAGCETVKSEQSEV